MARWNGPTPGVAAIVRAEYDLRMRSLGLIAGCAFAGGCLPFGGARPTSPVTQARADYRAVYGNGEIVGVVLDSATGAPVPNVLLFATTDTSPRAPVTPWRTSTDSAGRFAIPDVPVGWRVLEARGVGYARERRTLLVRRNRSDTLWMVLRTGTALLQQQREELSVPTAVTPCRPADVSTAWLANSLVEAMAADASVRKIRAEQVRLVDRPAMCRRAITAWRGQAGKPLHDPQVYLFEVGDIGYALYDPVEALGNNVVIVPLLDRDFRLIRILSL